MWFKFKKIFLVLHHKVSIYMYNVYIQVCSCDFVFSWIVYCTIGIFFYRLKDEKEVCVILDRLQTYLVPRGTTEEICRVYLRRIEHMYYKVPVISLTWRSLFELLTKDIQVCVTLNVHELGNEIYLRYDDKLSCNEKGVTC